MTSPIDGSVGDGDRDAVGRDAALGVARAVDRVDDQVGRAAAVQVDVAALLGDDGHRDVERLELAEDRVLGGAVDDERDVAALAAAGGHRAVGGLGEARELGAHAVAPRGGRRRASRCP